jgi:hypothetical protein
MENDDSKAKLPVNMVNEPIVNYRVSPQNRVAIFNSFEEAAEADYEFYRNLPPEQRMNIHYELSLRLFGENKTNLKGRFSFQYHRELTSLIPAKVSESLQ